MIWNLNFCVVSADISYNPKEQGAIPIVTQVLFFRVLLGWSHEWQKGIWMKNLEQVTEAHNMWCICNEYYYIVMNVYYDYELISHRHNIWLCHFYVWMACVACVDIVSIFFILNINFLFFLWISWIIPKEVLWFFRCAFDIL